MTTNTEALRQAREALAAWDGTIEEQYSGSAKAMGRMHDAMQMGVVALAAIDAALAQVGTPQTDPDYAESEAFLRAQEPRDERAAFEAWCADKFVCGDYSFARSNGMYVHTVSHRCEPFTYASVMMLWEAWRAAKAST